MKLKLKFFIEDNWKVLLGVIGGLAIVLIVIIALVGNKGNGLPEDAPKENSEEMFAVMDKDSEELKKVFSDLLTVDKSADEKYPILDVSLYLKQPFIDESDLKNALDKYVEMLKYKYNVSKEGKYILGVQIKLYDRKIVFDKGLTPRGTAYYMLDKSKELEKIEKNKKLSEEVSDSGVTDPNIIVWEQTVLDYKRPDYEDYRLTLAGFQPMKRNTAMNYLSDEEFAYYLKLKLYSTLVGNDTGGVKLYLQWDLGKDVTKDGLASILKDYRNFMDREKNTGIIVDYWDNPDKIKQELAIVNPQFVYFIETNKVEPDYSESQKQLILKNPELYKLPIENYINEVTEYLDENGNIDISKYSAYQELLKKYAPTIGKDYKEYKVSDEGKAVRMKGTDTIAEKKSKKELEKMKEKSENSEETTVDK